MPTYSAFPEIEVPAVLESWEDHSYRNDISASSISWIDEGNSVCLRVWVTYADVSEREYPKQPRYTLEFVANEWQMTDGAAKVLYKGESEAELERAIQKFHAGRAR